MPFISDAQRRAMFVKCPDVARRWAEEEKAMRAAGICLGSRTGWRTSGTGAPICRGCYRGPRSLDVPQPARRNRRWAGKVPDHPAGNPNEKDWRD